VAAAAVADRQVAAAEVHRVVAHVVTDQQRLDSTNTHMMLFNHLTEL
jgi:hypothetical protein